MKSIRHLAIAAVFGAAATFMALRFGGQEVRQLKVRVDELEQERIRLVEYARRLSATRRVAQVDILDQQPIEAGRQMTTLRWQEISEDGALGAPQTIDIFGTTAYFEAMVVKFGHDRVGNAEPGRAVSLALFRRIFGDRQEPASGFMLPDAANPTTAAAKEADPIGNMLWTRFWDFVDDPRLRDQQGIRVAQLEAPAVPVKPGQTWQITLDASGGLNVQKIAEQVRPAPPESELQASQ